MQYNNNKKHTTVPSFASNKTEKPESDRTLKHTEEANYVSESGHHYFITFKRAVKVHRKSPGICSISPSLSLQAQKSTHCQSVYKDVPPEGTTGETCLISL